MWGPYLTMNNGFESFLETALLFLFSGDICQIILFHKFLVTKNLWKWKQNRTSLQKGFDPIVFNSNWESKWILGGALSTFVPSWWWTEPFFKIIPKKQSCAMFYPTQNLIRVSTWLWGFVLNTQNYDLSRDRLRRSQLEIRYFKLQFFTTTLFMT